MTVRPLHAPRPAGRTRLTAGVALLVAVGCEGGLGRDPVPPRMLNPEPPFHYPAAMYARKVQGNVVLRLHVDARGTVQPESTSIAESSGYAALDSSAVRGSEALRFAPARRGDTPLAMSILFPVHFRHPGAPPMPGDAKPGTGGG
jgi:protein TonB